MSEKTYAILGGGGCFGINTGLYLLRHANPHRVIGIGRNPLRPAPFSLNIEKDPRYSYHARHVTYELDLLLELLDKERPQVIINYAAQGEGAASWKHSWRFFETNAVGLSRLVEALMERSYLERFIHIGTSELYGSVSEPAREDHPVKPSSPYAASKAAFDFYLDAVARHRGFPMNILRPSNAYCPGQLLHRVIPRAVVAGLQGRKIPLHGGGKARKSYIHASDLSRAILMVADSGQLGRTYNVGPQDPISILSLVEYIAHSLNLPLGDLVEIAQDRLGEDQTYWLDSSAIRNDLGWAPQIGLEEGIADMINWARLYSDQLSDWPTDYVLRG